MNLTTKEKFYGVMVLLAFIGLAWSRSNWMSLVNGLLFIWFLVRLLWIVTGKEDA